MTAPRVRSPLVTVQRWALTGIFIILSVAALRLGRTLLLPIAIAGLFALLLAKPVRWLNRRGLALGLAAGLIVLGSVGVFVTSMYLLAAPAASWISRAPSTLGVVQVRVRKLMRPFTKLKQTAEKVEAITQSGPQQVEVKVSNPDLLTRLSGTTMKFLGGLVTVVFLTYFLLAEGERFREKVGEFLHRRHHSEVEDGLHDMQGQMSTYLFTATVINTAVGVLTFGVLTLIGMPNPALWGVLAGVLNFIPYLGAIATMVMIALAGIVSFETTSQPLIAVGAFFVINLIEANVVTPKLMGRRLPLNPVAIFLGFLFWGWVWGIPGAVLAVPLTVMIQVIAARVPSLQTIGALLDS